MISDDLKNELSGDPEKQAAVAVLFAEYMNLSRVVKEIGKKAGEAGDDEAARYFAALLMESHAKLMNAGWVERPTPGAPQTEH